jgi:hypothetical protein
MSMLFSEAAAPATPATGKVALYAKTDGRVYSKDDAGTETSFVGVTSGTAVSASGTSVDFTGIPAGTKQITLSFSGLSTNGTSNLIVQIGDSGGIETTNYLGTVNDGGSPTNYSSGYMLRNGNAAANINHGNIIIHLVSSNTWVGTHLMGLSNTGVIAYGAGSKALSDTLDRIRLTTAGGTDTFDAGTVNIQYV